MRHSFGAWLHEEYGVKHAQERLGHSDPATALRHDVCLTAAARAKALAGLDEVTRVALARAETEASDDAAPSNAVELASRRQQAR
jgi:integrase